MLPEGSKVGIINYIFTKCKAGDYISMGPLLEMFPGLHE